MPADGMCHNCKKTPGEHFTVIKVIGMVGVPYPRRVWCASYSPQGRFCKPCALQEARERNGEVAA